MRKKQYQALTDWVVDLRSVSTEKSLRQRAVLRRIAFKMERFRFPDQLNRLSKWLEYLSVYLPGSKKIVRIHNVAKRMAALRKKKF